MTFLLASVPLVINLDYKTVTGKAIGLYSTLLYEQELLLNLASSHYKH